MLARVKALTMCAICLGTLGVSCAHEPELICAGMPAGAIITPNSARIAIGGTVRLTALTVTPSCGEVPDTLLLPIVWQVSDSSIIALINATDTSVVVNGLGFGQATVIATSKVYGGASSGALIHVDTANTE
jgi:hypothetical protein